MAGATAIGACVARHSVASRSSACPPARRARKSALAGATSTRSAQRASSMCPMAASAAASHSSLRTPRAETAWKVVAVTKRPAAGHDDLHFGAALAQPPHQVRTLVGGDAAGYTEEDAFALHGSNSLALPPLSHRLRGTVQSGVGKARRRPAFRGTRTGARPLEPNVMRNPVIRSAFSSC